MAEAAAEEMVKPGEPTRQFVTAVETQEATVSDEVGMEQVLVAQQAAGHARPSELYVDGAYVSAEAMATAQDEGWELVGPAQPWAATEAGYRVEGFSVEVVGWTGR